MINGNTFQALSEKEVLVLGGNGNLWLEHGPFGTVPPARPSKPVKVVPFGQMKKPCLLKIKRPIRKTRVDFYSSPGASQTGAFGIGRLYNLGSGFAEPAAEKAVEEVWGNGPADRINSARRT